MCITLKRGMVVVGLACLGAAFVSVNLYYFMPGKPVVTLAIDDRYNFMGPPTIDYYARGISRPPSVPANSAVVDDNESVIGVSVKGHNRAYRLNAMGHRTAHVVNDVIEHVPVTVTYCNLRNCVRGFTIASESDEPLNIAIRGLEDGKMRLSINDTMFLQEAEVVPVDRLDVEVTSWKEWKTAHPETDVVTGMHVDSAGAAD